MSTLRILPRTLALGLSLSLSAATTSLAATATTEPVGYNTISLLANSDTYISVPFHRPAIFVGQVASFSGNAITVNGSPGWTASQFVYAAGTQSNTYYAFIRSGAKEGNYYTVTANTANTLTLDLAGDTLDGLAANDSIALIPYWTLGTLFPTSDAGTSVTATTNVGARQTQILLPDIENAGINLAPSVTYFFFNGAWRRFGQSLTDSKDNDIIIPDAYLIVRNASTGGTFTSTGNVLVQKFVIPLPTNTSGKQDNAVAITRPVPVSLDDSGLIASHAFSASPSVAQRTDELLVFDNTSSANNKSASATYFYYNGAWRKFGADLTQDFGSTLVFTPDTAVIIRKASTANAATSIWTNSPTY